MGSSSSFEVYPDADPLDAARMCGAWYVIESTLDVWRTRINPTIIYDWIQPTEKEKQKSLVSGQPIPVRVKDTAEYRTGTLSNPSSSVGTFLGVDTQSSANSSVWHWSGTGMLTLFSGEWQMVKHDPDYRWAVTVFSATKVSPAGLDIYYRDPVMPDELITAIHAIISSIPFLQTRATGLFKTVQDPRGRKMES